MNTFTKYLKHEQEIILFDSIHMYIAERTRPRESDEEKKKNGHERQSGLYKLAKITNANRIRH